MSNVFVARSADCPLFIIGRRGPFDQRISAAADGPLFAPGAPIEGGWGERDGEAGHILAQS